MTSTTLMPIAPRVKKTKAQEVPARFFNVISLFSGAGGLDLGLEMAGYQTRTCVEFISSFRETIRRNRPEWNPIEDFNGDVTQISSDLILERAGLKKREVDLIVGGPPCQSFSNMGNRRGTNDARGRLFKDYIRIISEIRPLGFVFENVEGIKQHNVLDELQKELERLGYTVKCQTLNAVDYGVPQKRKRVVVVGCLGTEPLLPVPTHSKGGIVPGTKKWVTVGEAISQLTPKDLLRPDCKGMNHSEEMKRRMHMVPPGGNFFDVPKKYLPNCWTNGKHQGQDTFGRLRLDEPSVTIRTSGFNPTKGRYIHPLEDRGLNTLEMALLQSFPKDFKYYGSIKDIGTQIGNAVPPLLGKAIGEALKPCLIEARLKQH